MLDDSDDTIYLQGGDAYKTSDSDELITEDGTYTFTGSGDVECSKGYKTRWVMVYNNVVNNGVAIPGLCYDLLLWAIRDGISTISNFKGHYKLRYFEAVSNPTYIGVDAFLGCTSLIWCSGLGNIIAINPGAFQFCKSLKGFDSNGGYTIYPGSTNYQGVFAGCLSLDTLSLLNVATNGSSTNEYVFSNSHIKTVITDSNLTLLPFDDVDTFILKNGAKVRVGITGPMSNKTGTSGYYPIKIETPDDLYTIDISANASTATYNGILPRCIVANNVRINIYGTYNSWANLLTDIPYIKHLTIHLGTVSMQAPKSSSILCNSIGLKSIRFSGADLDQIDGLSLFCNNQALESIDFETLQMVASGYVSSSSYYYQRFITDSDNLKRINLKSVKTLSSKRYSNSSSYTSTMIYDLPSLESLDLSALENISYVNFNIDYSYILSKLPSLTTLIMPKLTNWLGILNEVGLENITIPSCCTVAHQSLQKCPQLKTIVFEEGAKCGVYSSSAPAILQYFGNNCPELSYVYLPASFEISDSTTSVTHSYRMFYNCPKLTTIELGQGYSKTLYLKHISTLSKECVVNILNALADLTDQTAQILYLHETTLGLLSDEEKAIATNKNWTLG